MLIILYCRQSMSPVNRSLTDFKYASTSTFNFFLVAFFRLSCAIQILLPFFNPLTFHISCCATSIMSLSRSECSCLWHPACLQLVFFLYRGIIAVTFYCFSDVFHRCSVLRVHLRMLFDRFTFFGV